MKTVVVTSRFDKQALYDFMMDELGGEAVVMKKYYGARIAKMAGDGVRLKDILEEADNKGWLDDFQGMKLRDIVNIINPSGALAPSSSRRLTKEQIARVQDDVLVYLGENPWQSKNQIAEGVDFDSKKLGAQLRALKEEDKIKSVGEKAGMKYALQSERSKP